MAVSKIKKPTPSWEYVGDAYWWGGSWICPADGFIELMAVPNADNWYWYVSDSLAADTGWSHCLSGNKTYQRSMTFMVKKGAELKNATLSGIGTAKAYYYKFT